MLNRGNRSRLITPQHQQILRRQQRMRYKFRIRLRLLPLIIPSHFVHIHRTPKQLNQILNAALFHPSHHPLANRVHIGCRFQQLLQTDNFRFQCLQFTLVDFVLHLDAIRELSGGVVGHQASCVVFEFQSHALQDWIVVFDDAFQLRQKQQKEGDCGGGEDAATGGQVAEGGVFGEEGGEDDNDGAGEGAVNGDADVLGVVEDLDFDVAGLPGHVDAHEEEAGFVAVDGDVPAGGVVRTTDFHLQCGRTTNNVLS